jgi:hypothetical protein
MLSPYTPPVRDLSYYDGDYNNAYRGTPSRFSLPVCTADLWGGCNNAVDAEHSFSLFERLQDLRSKDKWQSDIPVGKAKEPKLKKEPKPRYKPVKRATLYDQYVAGEVTPEGYIRGVLREIPNYSVESVKKGVVCAIGLQGTWGYASTLRHISGQVYNVELKGGSLLTMELRDAITQLMKLDWQYEDEQFNKTMEIQNDT